MTREEVKAGLKENGYIPNDEIAFIVQDCIRHRTPVILEGEPGCGKTSLAYAVKDMLGLPLLRVQFYDGLTADKILYDYDYQKQLLTIEAIRSSLEENLAGMTVDQAIASVKGVDFYNRDFLIERPVLKSITGATAAVLLLDEMDKSSEEMEHTLLEFLDGFSMSIPQYGTVACPEENRPLVFITSNRYRDLSDALKRRCNYLYIPQKTKEEIAQIIRAHIDISDELRMGIAECIAQIRRMGLKQPPSAAEAVTWAQSLKEIPETEYPDTVGLIAKNRQDREIVLKSGVLENLGR